MPAFWSTALAATALLVTGASSSQLNEPPSSESAEKPAAPDYALAVSSPGRDDADVALDESRKPAEILAFMGLEAGDTVLDVFAGGGYYSEIMARVVGPDGSVVAVNPPQFTTSEQSQAKWAAIRERQPNVTMVPSQLDAYEPEPDSVDFAMLHLIYHDFYWESERFNFQRMDPAVALANLFKGMKPGGIVAVVDHSGKPGNTREVVELTHRIDPVTARSDFLDAGFVLDGESEMFLNAEDDLDKNVFDPAVRGKTSRFVMRFRKPG